MREEIIKTEDGMVWMKFHLSPRERLGRLGRLLPDLFLPRFWDGNRNTYGPLDEIWDAFVSNLKEGILGYWIGCQPMEINIISLNQEKPHTCGSCKHSDNDLGFVSLRCAFIYEEMNNDEEHDGEWYDFAKVRSWNDCHYKPSKYEIRLSAPKVNKDG